MPGPIEDFLAAQALIVLDGGFATELERHGMNLDDPLWSARSITERPELVQAVHREYFEAGADVATAATYQATFKGFERHGIDHGAATRAMQEAVSLALAARDDFWRGASAEHGTSADLGSHGSRRRPLVAASIGSYGAMLADGSEYRGNYAVDDAALRDFHRPRLDILASSGADLLAFETIPCLREALVLARLLENHESLSAWMSFSCADGCHTAEGEDIRTCVQALNGHLQIAAVGVNCTEPRWTVELLTLMQDSTDKPLLAYPNSGEHYDASTRSWKAPAPAPALAARTAEGSLTFAQQSLAWYEAGARLIGGCCRTSPADIRALRALHAV